MPANPMLAALLEEEKASRRANLTPRPLAAGNPVMEQMGGGFQITPEELAFKAQGDPGRAWGRAIFQGVLGGPGQGISGYRKSMRRSKAEETQEMLGAAYGRLIETEGRTPADMNEMAYFRAKLTGEQPRTFRPPGLQTSFRERLYIDENGKSRLQPEFVSVDAAGRVVRTEKYGDSKLLTSGKSRAPLTSQQVSDYRNTLDVRARIARGGWEQQVLDVIQAIDPDRDVDLENEGAALALISGAPPSARLAQYVIDDVNSLAKALESVPGDPESQEPTRKRLQREHKKNVMDIWRKHKYGETGEEAAASKTEAAAAGAAAKAEADRRIAALGAVGAPPAATAAESEQGRSLFDRAQEIVSYARQPAAQPRAVRDPSVPGFRLEQFAGPGLSGIVPPMTTGTGPPPEMTPAYTRGRQTKKFRRGDKERRTLSPLERTLAEIVNGESAAR